VYDGESENEKYTVHWGQAPVIRYNKKITEPQIIVCPVPDGSHKLRELEFLYKANFDAENENFSQKNRFFWNESNEGSTA
jgi:hypothetical protein